MIFGAAKALEEELAALKYQASAGSREWEELRNASPLNYGSPWNDIRGAAHTYAEGHRGAATLHNMTYDELSGKLAREHAQVEDALTPRAGEYRPLTRFQRFRVRLYAPLFRLARRRGIIAL